MITVLIPTWRRADKLKDCLAALAAQSVEGGLNPRAEILVVADGQGDPAREVVEASGPVFSANPVFEAPVFMERPHAGPAAARNAGVRAARRGLVAFIGDDIICRPGWLAAHLDWHRSHPEDVDAALGLTELHPSIPETPVLRHLYKVGGQQFQYHGLKPGDDAGYGRFYTSNLSVKRSFLLREGLFEESFPYAAMEDVELGLRLKRSGMRLTYVPGAAAWHDHPMDLGAALLRQRRVGHSMVQFCRLHPEAWPGVRESARGCDEGAFVRVRAAAEALCAMDPAWFTAAAPGDPLRERYEGLVHTALGRTLALAQGLGVLEAGGAGGPPSA